MRSPNGGDFIEIWCAMSHSLDGSDFRSQRWVLDPDDFALSDRRPDSPPSDLVAQEIWHHLTVLASDVSIRTSDHRGTALTLLCDWKGEWIEAVGDPDAPDVLFGFMLDASDSLAAAVFLALHGHYATSAGVLRSALERTVVGCAVQITGNVAIAERDASPFGPACDALSNQRRIKALHEQLMKAVGFGVFEARRGGGEIYEGGWARRLYKKLSKFSHSTGDHSDGAIWRSNGPIYVDRAFDDFVEMVAETLACSYVAVKLARDAFSLGTGSKQVFGAGGLFKVGPIVALCYETLFPQ